ncbi:MAG: hypothetical protein VYA34_04220, partial [Myxococcota bacterium]|nr:hypothetical protein [Myxococcota bacterium]
MGRLKVWMGYAMMGAFAIVEGCTCSGNVVTDTRLIEFEKPAADELISVLNSDGQSATFDVALRVSGFSGNVKLTNLSDTTAEVKSAEVSLGYARFPGYTAKSGSVQLRAQFDEEDVDVSKCTTTGSGENCTDVSFYVSSGICYLKTPEPGSTQTSDDYDDGDNLEDPVEKDMFANCEGVDEGANVALKINGFITQVKQVASKQVSFPRVALGEGANRIEIIAGTDAEGANASKGTFETTLTVNTGRCEVHFLPASGSSLIGVSDQDPELEGLQAELLVTTTCSDSANINVSYRDKVSGDGTYTKVSGGAGVSKDVDGVSYRAVSLTLPESSGSKSLEVVVTVEETNGSRNGASTPNYYTVDSSAPGITAESIAQGLTTCFSDKDQTAAGYQETISGTLDPRDVDSTLWIRVYEAGTSPANCSAETSCGLSQACLGTGNDAHCRYTTAVQIGGGFSLDNVVMPIEEGGSGALILEVIALDQVGNQSPAVTKDIFVATSNTSSIAITAPVDNAKLKADDNLNGEEDAAFDYNVTLQTTNVAVGTMITMIVGGDVSNAITATVPVSAPDGSANSYGKATFEQRLTLKTSSEASLEFEKTVKAQVTQRCSGQTPDPAESLISLSVDMKAVEIDEASISPSKDVTYPQTGSPIACLKNTDDSNNSISGIQADFTGGFTKDLEPAVGSKVYLAVEGNASHGACTDQCGGGRVCYESKCREVYTLDTAEKVAAGYVFSNITVRSTSGRDGLKEVEITVVEPNGGVGSLSYSLYAYLEEPTLTVTSILEGGVEKPFGATPIYLGADSDGKTGFQGSVKVGAAGLANLRDPVTLSIYGLSFRNFDLTKGSSTYDGIVTLDHGIESTLFASVDDVCGKEIKAVPVKAKVFSDIPPATVSLYEPGDTTTELSGETKAYSNLDVVVNMGSGFTGEARTLTLTAQTGVDASSGGCSGGIDVDLTGYANNPKVVTDVTSHTFEALPLAPDAKNCIQVLVTDAFGNSSSVATAMIQTSSAAPVTLVDGDASTVGLADISSGLVDSDPDKVKYQYTFYVMVGDAGGNGDDVDGTLFLTIAGNGKTNTYEVPAVAGTKFYEFADRNLEQSNSGEVENTITVTYKDSYGNTTVIGGGKSEDSVKLTAPASAGPDLEFTSPGAEAVVSTINNSNQLELVVGLSGDLEPTTCDISHTKDGGSKVLALDDVAWVESATTATYTLTLPDSGSYDLEILCQSSSEVGGATLRMTIDNDAPDESHLSYVNLSGVNGDDNYLVDFGAAATYANSYVVDRGTGGDGVSLKHEVKFNITENPGDMKAILTVTRPSGGVDTYTTDYLKPGDETLTAAAGGAASGSHAVTVTNAGSPYTVQINKVDWGNTDGTFQFSLVLEDRAGLQSAAKTATIQKDRVAPDFTIATPNAGWVEGSSIVLDKPFDQNIAGDGILSTRFSYVTTTSESAINLSWVLSNTVDGNAFDLTQLEVNGTPQTGLGSLTQDKTGSGTSIQTDEISFLLDKPGYQVIATISDAAGNTHTITSLFETRYFEPGIQSVIPADQVFKSDSQSTTAGFQSIMRWEMVSFVAGDTIDICSTVKTGYTPSIKRTSNDATLLTKDMPCRWGVNASHNISGSEVAMGVGTDEPLGRNSQLNVDTGQFETVSESYTQLASFVVARFVVGNPSDAYLSNLTLEDGVQWIHAESTQSDADPDESSSFRRYRVDFRGPAVESLSLKQCSESVTEHCNHAGVGSNDEGASGFVRIGAAEGTTQTVVVEMSGDADFDGGPDIDGRTVTVTATHSETGQVVTAAGTLGSCSGMACGAEVSLNLNQGDGDYVLTASASDAFGNQGDEGGNMRVKLASSAVSVSFDPSVQANACLVSNGVCTAGAEGDGDAEFADAAKTSSENQAMQGAVRFGFGDAPLADSKVTVTVYDALTDGTVVSTTSEKTVVIGQQYLDFQEVDGIKFQPGNNYVDVSYGDAFGNTSSLGSRQLVKVDFKPPTTSLTFTNFSADKTTACAAATVGTVVEASVTGDGICSDTSAAPCACVVTLKEGLNGEGSFQDDTGLVGISTAALSDCASAHKNLSSSPYCNKDGSDIAYTLGECVNSNGLEASCNAQVYLQARLNGSASGYTTVSLTGVSDGKLDLTADQTLATSLLTQDFRFSPGLARDVRVVVEDQNGNTNYSGPVVVVLNATGVIMTVEVKDDIGNFTAVSNGFQVLATHNKAGVGDCEAGGMKVNLRITAQARGEHDIGSVQLAANSINHTAPETIEEAPSKMVRDFNCVALTDGTANTLQVTTTNTDSAAIGSTTLSDLQVDSSVPTFEFERCSLCDLAVPFANSTSFCASPTCNSRGAGGDLTQVTTTGEAATGAAKWAMETSVSTVVAKSASGAAANTFRIGAGSLQPNGLVVFTTGVPVGTEVTLNGQSSAGGSATSLATANTQACSGSGDTETCVVWFSGVDVAGLGNTEYYEIYPSFADAVGNSAVAVTARASGAGEKEAIYARVDVTPPAAITPTLCIGDSTTPTGVTAETDLPTYEPAACAALCATTDEDKCTDSCCRLQGKATVAWTAPGDDGSTSGQTATATNIVVAALG